MKTFKRILWCILILFLVVSANGCYYLFKGQSKSMAKLLERKELNLYECCSIYSIHTAAWMFGWVLSPEAADQCFLMAFAKEGSRHRRRGDFSNSVIFQEQSYNQEGLKPFTLNYPLNEITGDKKSPYREELRYALAFDGALFTVEHDFHREPVLKLDVKYHGYTAKYSIGPFNVIMYWKLFKYIQERGWLHKCHITYYDKTNNFLIR